MAGMRDDPIMVWMPLIFFLPFRFTRAHRFLWPTIFPETFTRHLTLPFSAILQHSPFSLCFFPTFSHSPVSFSWIFRFQNGFFCPNRMFVFLLGFNSLCELLVWARKRFLHFAEKTKKFCFVQPMRIFNRSAPAIVALVETNLRVYFQLIRYWWKN